MLEKVAEAWQRTSQTFTEIPPMADTPQQPEITYPTPWQYKLVGREQTALRTVVAEVVGQRAYALELSHRSRKGSYVSMNLELTVVSEADRLSLYASLGASPHVLYVL